MNYGVLLVLYAKAIMKMLKGATNTLSWIDDRLAVGDEVDARLYASVHEMDIVFVIDVRSHFSGVEMIPLPSVVKFADSLVELTKLGKVLVHCQAGIDRSPFVAMLYYAIKYNCSYEHAYDAVASKRPQTFIHYDWIKLIDKYETS